MNQQSILSDILANIFDVFIAVHKYIKELEDYHASDFIFIVFESCLFSLDK